MDDLKQAVRVLGIFWDAATINATKDISTQTNVF